MAAYGQEKGNFLPNASQLSGHSNFVTEGGWPESQLGTLVSSLHPLLSITDSEVSVILDNMTHRLLPGAGEPEESGLTPPLPFQYKQLLHVA